MTPNRSPEFKGVIVQKKVCLIEILFESACPFYQYRIGKHLPCLMGPKVHTSEPSGSAGEDCFFIFSYEIYGSNTGPSGEDPF